MSRLIRAAALASSLLLLAAPAALSLEPGAPQRFAQAPQQTPQQEAPAVAAPQTNAPAAPAAQTAPASGATTTAPVAAPAATAPAAGTAVAAPQGAGGITDDTARFLAGLAPSANSPLAALTRDAGWQAHARFFDRAFGQLESTQLAKVRTWSKTQLRVHSSTMYYMFSGPDFLYADAFYPEATTYVLVGLEPVGQIPDITRLPRGAVAPALAHIASSMHTVLNFSFFITKNMSSQLSSGPLHGTAPILYVFLSRAGKTLQGANLVNLDKDGNLQPETWGAKGAARGIKITFSGRDGRQQTLYYFSTNLGNDGVGTSGLLPFLEKLAPGDSLIKSASYLLHGGHFSKIRDFLLAHSATILQDDSGIPLAHFDRQKWALTAFGHYLPPLGIFPGTYQPRLAEMFAKGRSTPMDFGVGYRWRSSESNLLLAVRNSASTGGIGSSTARTQ